MPMVGQCRRQVPPAQAHILLADSRQASPHPTLPGCPLPFLLSPQRTLLTAIPIITSLLKILPQPPTALRIKTKLLASVQGSPKPNSSLLLQPAVPRPFRSPATPSQDCLFSELPTPHFRSLYLFRSSFWMWPGYAGYAAGWTPVPGFLTTGSLRKLPFWVPRACPFLP